MKIRKAIIPVAGMGTRFLPAAKAQPKEMFPVIDKPVIQYIVEEAVAAGIEEIIFVTAIGKRALEDHFDKNFELDQRLREKGKLKELTEVQKVARLAKYAFVRQLEPRGDGDAILSALPFISPDEPVAILFGDDIVSGKIPGIKQLISVYEKMGQSVVGVQEVPHADVSRYGVIGGKEISKHTWNIEHFVEKPQAKDAPSNMAVIGRYVVTPDVLTKLKNAPAGKDGEVRLADAFISHLKSGGKLSGCALQGKRYDCGNKAQFVIAQIELGLEHPDVKDELKKYLKGRK